LLLLSAGQTIFRLSKGWLFEKHKTNGDYLVENLTFPQKPKTTDFRMDVPYNNQNDNANNKGQGEGWRQCNLTSAAMLAKYLKPSLWSEYKDFANGMQDALAPYGDTTDHAAITKALTSIGIESYFSYSASLEDLAHSLFSGVPVLIGRAYKASGHMMLVIGRQQDGSVMMHDPYGYSDGYTNQWLSIGGQSGKNDSASIQWLKRVFVDQGSESGWARFVTHVDGRPTGVRTGM
jgi:hypothetical protein